MAKEKETWYEKGLRLFVHVASIGIALVVTAFLYWIPQPCDIDKVYLYCRTHPGSPFDILGMILFWGSCIWLGGFYKYFINPYDDDNPIYRTITVWAWIAGIAGCLFIYAL